MQFSYFGAAIFFCGVFSVLISSFHVVIAESKCFEDMDQLFQEDTNPPKDPEYYRLNIKAPKTYPHLASIRSRAMNKCVGVILSRRYILSSAVCLKSPRQPATTVWLGDMPTKNATAEYKRLNSFNVEEIVLHPQYNENTFFRNIGLLRLSRDIDFNSRRYPACVDVELSAQRELALSLVSYNRVQEWISVTDYETCNEYFDIRDILESEQFCASVKQNCDYPSGSLLQRSHETLEKIYTVVGVVSFRKDCKLAASQLVFTRIFLEWIEGVVGGDHL